MQYSPATPRIKIAFLSIMIGSEVSIIWLWMLVFLSWRTPKDVESVITINAEEWMDNQ